MDPEWIRSWLPDSLFGAAELGGVLLPEVAAARYGGAGLHAAPPARGR